MLSNLFKKRGSFDLLFYPKSVAVIGASNDTEKIGGFIFSQIKKNKSIKSYPINIKWERIQGCKAYKNIIEIGRIVDLVIIAVPKKVALDSIEDCAKFGIKNLVIITAGFKETGEEGKKEEEKIKELIKKYNLNLIGPNCLGILNPQIKLNCSFAKDLPRFGNFALISQSGAVIDAIIDWSFKHKIGFSKIVSLGNMAGIDELEMLEYLKEDKTSSAIIFYMETLENGKKFKEVLFETSKKKPVIIIKPGKSSAAKKAIGSHTGSLAQDSILVETLIKQSNGILVNSLNELFNVMIALKSKKHIKNNKIVVLTNAGGPGVITTDSIENSSFELYQLSKNQKEILEGLPKEASLNNPIDILGDAKSDRYKYALQKLIKFNDLGNICVLLTPQVMTDSKKIAQEILDISKKTDKNIFSSFIGEKEIKESENLFDSEGFANFSTPTEAIVAMDYLNKYYSFNYEHNKIKYPFDNKKIKEINKILEKKEGLLDFSLSKKIFEVLAIHLPQKHIIKKFDDIKNINLKENKNYVLKADSKNLIHKKEFGGVILGVTKKNLEEKTIEMFDEFIGFDDLKITLEEEYRGTEVIIGLKSDENLGDFIMFGMGGTYVSIFNDINFSLCPLNKNSAKELVQKSKVYGLLEGYRDLKPIHLDTLYEILIRISYLLQLFPKIKEVDINPMICNEKGIYLVDVKLICCK